MDKKGANNCINNWKISLEGKVQGDLKIQGDQLFITLKTGANDKRGTYLTKRQIIKLAGYVSYEFEDAVYEAFELLSEGKIHEASGVVESVAVSQELIDMAFKMEDELKIAINNWQGEKERSFQSKHICIRKHILSKTLTGNPNIKELRDMFDSKNFVDTFRKLNHKIGLTAFIETVNIIIPMLEANLSYYVIRDMINKMSEMWNNKIN